MDYQTVMNKMLHPVEIDGATYSPGVTWYNGIRQGFGAVRSDGTIHKGVDFNYSGVYQSGINLTHPDAFSPVSGTVVEKNAAWGRIVITDSMGYRHYLTHLDSLTADLQIGDRVTAGESCVGQMGGRGPTGPNQYQQHVDYKVRNPAGALVDPETNWNDAGQNGYWPNPYDYEYGPYVPGSSSLMDMQESAGIDRLAPFTDLYDEASTTAPWGYGSPLILDLDGDGVETTDVKDGAYFDHEGNGFSQQTGWVSSDDGLLVRDINSDGIINDGKELFSNETLLQRQGNGVLYNCSIQIQDVGMPCN